jgi:Flp pilus assembly protein TadG
MLARFGKDENGAAMVEMTIVLTLFLLLTMGFVDFAHAFYRWNSASKAVQVAARMASISDPVATALTVRPWGGSTPGAPTGAYGPYECVGGASTCIKLGGGEGTPLIAANFNRIFRGDTDASDPNSDACNPPTGTQRRGLCHFLPGIRRENVVITYTGSGLGYQGRAAGAVPTITVELRNVNFQFFFVGPLLDIANAITMPTMLSTVTGEDMKAGWES